MNWPAWTEGNKILVTALVASFSTACITEPVKAWVARWLRRRELRQALYWEIVNSFGELLKQLDMAEHDDKMKAGLGSRFKRWGYQRLTYDLAQTDPPTFYRLGHLELYWLRLLYADFDSVVRDGEDDETTFIRAQSTVHSVLSDVKNRHLNQRLVFRVSPDWLRAHLRQSLPSFDYHPDRVPPGFRVRCLRRYDQLTYWMWGWAYRKSTPPDSSKT
jgi:hypothetical protein